VILYQVVNVSF